MTCFDQTCVLFRSDVCPLSIRRVSCFDQTCDLFRSDVCPVSIRRVSCLDQISTQRIGLVGLSSSRRIGYSRLIGSSRLASARLVVSARQLISAHLGFFSFARLGVSARIGSSRLARLGISSRLFSSRLFSSGSSCHGSSLHASSRHGSSRHGSSRRGSSRHGSYRHGSSRHGSCRHDSSRHGSSRRGSSRHGSSRRLFLAHRLVSSRSFHRWRCVALMCFRLSLSSATISSFHRVELPVKSIAGTCLDAISNQRESNAVIQGGNPMRESNGVIQWRNLFDCFTNHYDRFTGRHPSTVLRGGFGSASQTIPYGLLPTPCCVSWQVDSERY